MICEGGSMSLTSFDTSNPQIRMIMILRMQKLKTEQIPTLCYENLENYLEQSLWKEHCPTTLHEAVDQVLRVEANDIVRFLEMKAITEGAKAKLEDFSDMLGGNNEDDQQQKN